MNHDRETSNDEMMEISMYYTKTVSSKTLELGFLQAGEDDEQEMKFFLLETVKIGRQDIENV